MKQTTKRFTSMIGGLVFFTAALFVYFELIQPAYGDAQSLKAQILGLENFLNTQETAVLKVQNLIAAYKGKNGAQSAVSAALPGREDAAGALAQISGIAEESGIALQAVSVATNAPSTQPGGGAQTSRSASLVKPVGTLVFQAKLVGPYETLKTFLALLETNMRILDVVSLASQPAAIGTAKSAQATYAYDLSVATYYQAP